MLKLAITDNAHLILFTIFRAIVWYLKFMYLLLWHTSVTLASLNCHSSNLMIKIKITVSFFKESISLSVTFIFILSGYSPIHVQPLYKSGFRVRFVWDYLKLAQKVSLLHLIPLTLILSPHILKLLLITLLVIFF